VNDICAKSFCLLSMQQTAGIKFTHRLKISIFVAGTRFTDSHEIWHSRGARWVVWPCKILRQSVPGGGNVVPKWQKFPLFGKELPHRGKPFDRFLHLLGVFICPTTLH